MRDELSKFWTIESVEDDLNDAVIEQFKNNISFNGKRYVTKLPFKSEHDMLPDNFEMCKQRLKSLKKRLNNNPELLNEYDKIIADYKNKGIVEVVHDPGWDTEPGGVHYLPHRAVIRADKETTKVRVVFDASANVESSPSLNQCLESGPNLLKNIFDILLRFRLNEIGMTADIRQAFLNIEIHEEHRNFLRFLWYDEVSKDDAKIIVLRFLRVVFGVNSSP